MYAFVDKQPDAFGVEAIWEVLQVAASAYGRNAARAENPSLLSPRAQRDAALAPQIEAVLNANFKVCGATGSGSRSTSRE
jgi:putative transposase